MKATGLRKLPHYRSRGADRSVLIIVVVRSPALFLMSGCSQLMWNMQQSQSADCDIDHSERDLPPAVSGTFGSTHCWRRWDPCSQIVWAGCTKSLDWFPVTAELCSTILERLRGVLVDARLGVTGKGYGAHGLSGRRPIANSFSPSRSRRGSTHP